MKALRFKGSETSWILSPDEHPDMQPGPGEILIRVHAAGITPTEVQWYPTWHTKEGGNRQGAIPAHEFSGVVAATGLGVTGLRLGDEVYGMNDWFCEGALAECCVTTPALVARKPQSLTHTQAASVPIGALTAWQGLFNRARLQKGETVLVHGGAGSVGLFAVQLAKNHGARVIATASAGNLALVKHLGADMLIDYRTSRFEDAAGEVNVVFDTVGGETLQRSWSILKPGGRLVTVAASGETARDKRTQQAFFIVEGNSDQLNEISRLLESGSLQCVVNTVLPFEQAVSAFTRPPAQHSGPGKTVIIIP